MEVGQQHQAALGLREQPTPVAVAVVVEVLVRRKQIIMVATEGPVS